MAPGKLASEIKGIPRAVLRDQSRRHREIVDRMADRGESGDRHRTSWRAYRASYWARRG